MSTTSSPSPTRKRFDTIREVTTKPPQNILIRTSGITMSAHSEEPQAQRSHNPRGYQRKRRAGRACLECRRRKVRCNVEIYGRPCTNCLLDGCECVTCNRSRKPVSNPSQVPDVEDAVAFSRESQPATRSESRAVASGKQFQMAADHEEEAARVTGLDAPAITSLESPRPTKRLRYSPAHETIANTLLPFSSYAYLRPPDLQHLQPAEMAFLESQKCTHVPTQPLLGNLLRHYFLYAHPSLPIINEGEFWSILGGRNKEVSSMSLLVFQAMLFVACSYIPLSVAKDSGASSILEMRNSFYKRAKMLYDFGVERDLLRRSQAAALLSYESSSSDISGNSTWLALAIQHARIINAHLYDHLPENGSYKRSDLKRLWWSLILRDRIIALGMRRPLQILPSSFEVAFPEILQLQDFADEKHSSKVYDPEIKSALCDIISSQCSLAIALTPLIMTIYPPDQISGSSENLTSLLDRAEDAKLRLHYWRSQHGFLFSTPQKEGHTSITLFKLLTALYYESGRLTLHHHIAFWRYQSRRLQSPSKLLDAVTSIDSILKRFVIDGIINRLPISVVAFAILPQILMTFNMRLSNGGISHKEQGSFLKVYEELNKLHRLRYDVSHISSWMSAILRLFETSLSPHESQFNKSMCNKRQSQNRNLAWLLERYPALYFRLLDSMNCAVSTGHFTLQDSDTLMVSPPMTVAKSPRVTLLPTAMESQTSNQTNPGENFINGQKIFTPDLDSFAYGSDGAIASFDTITPLQALTSGPELSIENFSPLSPCIITALDSSLLDVGPPNWTSFLSMTLSENVDGESDRSIENDLSSTDAFWLDIARLGE